MGDDDADNAIELFDDRHLFRLAQSLGDLWEDFARATLTVENAEKISGSVTACLPVEQLDSCSDLSPSDAVVQAYHMLCRWRYYSWSVGCSQRKAAEDFIKGLRKFKINQEADRMTEQLNLLNSLEFV